MSDSVSPLLKIRAACNFETWEKSKKWMGQEYLDIFIWLSYTHFCIGNSTSISH